MVIKTNKKIDNQVDNRSKLNNWPMLTYTLYLKFVYM